MMTDSGMRDGTPLEIEVKLRLPGLEDLPPRLESLGFQLETPLQDETSTLWDRGAELFDQGCALRVRRYGGGATLTWKGPKRADPLLKIRPELETAVADAEILEGILKVLGYAPVMRMVKQRAVYRRGGLVACLDRAPFGCFLELEGSEKDILEARASLGLSGAEVEVRGYPGLFRAYGLA